MLSLYLNQSTAYDLKKTNLLFKLFVVVSRVLIILNSLKETVKGHILTTEYSSVPVQNCTSVLLL